MEYTPYSLGAKFIPKFNTQKTIKIINLNFRGFLVQKTKNHHFHPWENLEMSGKT